MLRWTCLLWLSLPLGAQVESWDLPPVRYSDTAARDRVAIMAEKWAANPELLTGKTPLARLREVLAALRVPEASQILVFSKTSEQIRHIHPQTPRALYFSPDTYCGYVPGGAMEVIVQDARLGPVFYLIDLGDAAKPVRVERDTSGCLSCHGTGRTENVPGLLVRSVFPDEDGQPLLANGSSLVTHQTPVPERWGGYYVTGTISLPHLGNRTYVDGGGMKPAVQAWKDVTGKIDTSGYLRASSDIVALMVLEHQCHAHNLLTAASMNYRRARHLALAINPDADPDAGAAGSVADRAAEKIASWFLFAGEADQGPDGVQGDEEFQRQFERQIPRTADGKSLADFELNGRLFKNRCSYMIYSEAFRELPDRVKSRVIAELRKVLENPRTDDAYPSMKLAERRRTAAILRETGIWE